MCKPLGSCLELSAFESPLEVELAKVVVVSRSHLPVAVEVEERTATEVDLPWVIHEEVDDHFLCTAAA
jgi:hypothetical protein